MEIVLKRVGELFEELLTMEVPLSETLKGTNIHQTFRNKLTERFANALYEDLVECLPLDGSKSVIPFSVSKGVIFDVPNALIADNTPDDYSGAMSLGLYWTFHDLECSAEAEQEEYFFKRAQAEKKAKETQKRKQAEYERAVALRKARQQKREQLAEMTRFED